MTPQLQTRISPLGDCIRACIASLLGVRITEVPDFIMEIDEIKDSYPKWWHSMQQWLGKRGFFFLDIELGNIQWLSLPFDAFAIAIGDTPNGCPHAIIVKCEHGDFVPSFCPLGGDPDVALKDGIIRRVCFLVPRDAQIFQGMGQALERIEMFCKSIPNAEIAQAIQLEVNQGLGRQIIDVTPDLFSVVREEAPPKQQSLILGPDGRHV